jgi:hypothetical protein
VYEVGKRLTCPECGTQCLVIGASAPGELTCCDQPMNLDAAKKLPSSD